MLGDNRPTGPYQPGNSRGNQSTGPGDKGDRVGGDRPMVSRTETRLQKANRPGGGPGPMGSGLRVIQGGRPALLSLVN